MIDVMIIDDHPIVREGLEMMLAHRPRFNVVATAASGEEALAWCRKNKLPEVVLCDVMMSKMDGFATLNALKKEFPSVKVMLLTGMPRREDEARARQAGASGYMSKSSDTNLLSDMIAKVAGGILDFVSDTYVPHKAPFSSKELETLKYLALGKTRDEIAIIMSASPETIKTRIVEIRRKLDASNTTAAIARAYELGYLI